VSGEAQWELPTAGLQAPLVAVDLDAFDANADDLVRRAGGLPIRVASKSVRCRTLLDRALARPGFAGVMAYAVAEAVWLATEGLTDVFVAYPSVDAPALRAVATDDRLRAEVTVAVDSVEHVRWLREALGADVRGLGVAVDVDASLRIGRLHLGVRRSPTRSPAQTLAVVRAAAGVGLDVRGLMFYDAQVAGLPDAGPHVRAVKRRSVLQLAARRRAVVDAVRREVDLRFVNAGGTGSLHLFGDDTVVSELAAGSGLYGPTLFDGYDDFRPRPAMAFALPVVRRPAPGHVTAFGGGYVASGAPGWSRVPSPVRRGLALVRAEGTGEVQTPLRGRVADELRVGDRVWMRGAKAGELLERFAEVHLVSGGELVDTVPSYRGEGRCFG
jgi:D-serine deaminase-like pyridoxal phosphate-dependent protein